MMRLSLTLAALLGIAVAANAADPPPVVDIEGPAARGQR